MLAAVGLSIVALIFAIAVGNLAATLIATAALILGVVFLVWRVNRRER